MRRRNAQIIILNKVNLIRRRRRHLYRRQSKAAARGYHRQCSVRRERIDNHFNAAAAAARKRGIGCEGVGCRANGYLTSVAEGMVGCIVGFNNIHNIGAHRPQLLADVAVVDRHRLSRNRGNDQTGAGAHSADKLRLEEVCGEDYEQFNARGDGHRLA